eukprot:4813492-Pyramimonas_sp.AAC.3
MYNPTPEQAEKDRQRAYETGIPHGYVPPGDKYAGHATIRLKVKSELVQLPALSQSCLSGSRNPCTGLVSIVFTCATQNVQHTDEEYGGPFWIDVSPKMKVEDLRKVIKNTNAYVSLHKFDLHPDLIIPLLLLCYSIVDMFQPSIPCTSLWTQDKCGILPGLQRLAYAGKNFEDSNRTLEQCVHPSLFSGLHVVVGALHSLESPHRSWLPRHTAGTHADDGDRCECATCMMLWGQVLELKVPRMANHHSEMVETSQMARMMDSTTAFNSTSFVRTIAAKDIYIGILLLRHYPVDVSSVTTARV